MLSVGSHTPSRSVAGHEAVRAVQNTIAQLPEDYRQAVQLRLLEGRSLEEVAEAMDRPPGRYKDKLTERKRKCAQIWAVCRFISRGRDLANRVRSLRGFAYHQWVWPVP